MTFEELKIGDTFDFISPDSWLNSFYQTCTKISARGYQWKNPKRCSLSPDEFFTSRVGTVKVEVYHVNGVTE